MAVPPKTSDVFFREVDEELRRDQLLTAWRRYGRIAVVVVIVALLALAGFLWWQHHREQQHQASGEQLSQALTDLGSGHPQAANTSLATLATSDVPGYRAAARMTQADVALSNRDTAGAARLFAAVAADANVGQPFRDLAMIRQTSAEFDRLPPQTVIDRLAPLRRADNAFFGSAAEMTALAYLKLNRPREAGALFAQIVRNRHAPAAIKDRAAAMAGSLGVDVGDQTEGNTIQ